MSDSWYRWQSCLWQKHNDLSPVTRALWEAAISSFCVRVPFKYTTPSSFGRVKRADGYELRGMPGDLQLLNDLLLPPNAYEPGAYIDL
jgi:hypothetical protein